MVIYPPEYCFANSKQTNPWKNIPVHYWNLLAIAPSPSIVQQLIPLLTPHHFQQPKAHFAVHRDLLQALLQASN
jgi:hypothetical protein